jgi:hypothetical protein
VFEVGEAEGVPFMVMPWLEGVTLSARLAELAQTEGERGRAFATMTLTMTDIASGWTSFFARIPRLSPPALQPGEMPPRLAQAFPHLGALGIAGIGETALQALELRDQQQPGARIVPTQIDLVLLGREALAQPGQPGPSVRAARHA